MSSINWGRVVLGALLAGIVINVVEFILNGVVLAKDWSAAMTALGIPPVAGSQIAVFFVGALSSGAFSSASSRAGSMRPFVRATALDRRPRCAPDCSCGFWAIY